AWAAPGGPGGVLHGERRRLQVSGVAELADAHLSGCGSDGWEQIGRPVAARELARRCWRERSFGDFWSHMLVAEGACDIGVDPIVSLWDVAALVPIVEEAGGRLTDLSGVARADGGSAVSTNGRLHDQVLAVVGDAATGKGP
ncbi:histidinol phosphatase, partial [Acidimicrobiaceae bacterium USS-CC1]|nr:histidinol phosphatase [Acidiferrimicrobium australe]